MQCISPLILLNYLLYYIWVQYTRGFFRVIGGIYGQNARVLVDDWSLE